MCQYLSREKESPEEEKKPQYMYQSVPGERKQKKTKLLLT
jgi:hypothetical protein